MNYPIKRDRLYSINDTLISKLIKLPFLLLFIIGKLKMIQLEISLKNHIKFCDNIHNRLVSN